MSRYMNGLFVSDALWLNHASAMNDFAKVYLPTTLQGGLHLEIGPGHGMLLHLALRFGRFRACSAWDVSATSVAHARHVLEALDISDRVDLRLTDLYSQRRCIRESWSVRYDCFERSPRAFGAATRGFGDHSRIAYRDRDRVDQRARERPSSRPSLSVANAARSRRHRQGGRSENRPQCRVSGRRRLPRSSNSAGAADQLCPRRKADRLSAFQLVSVPLRLSPARAGPDLYGRASGARRRSRS